MSESLSSVNGFSLFLARLVQLETHSSTSQLEPPTHDSSMHNMCSWIIDQSSLDFSRNCIGPSKLLDKFHTELCMEGISNAEKRNRNVNWKFIFVVLYYAITVPFCHTHAHTHAREGRKIGQFPFLSGLNASNVRKRKQKENTEIDSARY